MSEHISIPWNQASSLETTLSTILAAQRLTMRLIAALIQSEHPYKGELQKIMAGITDIQTAQTAEKADLVALTTLIGQLLSAFASGAMTPAQAQAVLDEINSEDATIKTNISTITAALPPAAPATT